MSAGSAYAACVPIRVLLVDDVVEVRRLVRTSLRFRGGFEVVGEAADGAEAVQLADQLRPDVVVLDLGLPDMSGIDILEKVKSNVHTKRLPVIILTTTDDEREIQRCYDLGANVYITKPVDYDGFANAIRQLGLFFSVMQIP